MNKKMFLLGLMTAGVVYFWEDLKPYLEKKKTDLEKFLKQKENLEQDETIKFEELEKSELSKEAVKENYKSLGNNGFWEEAERQYLENPEAFEKYNDQIKKGVEQRMLIKQKYLENEKKDNSKKKRKSKKRQ